MKLLDAIDNLNIWKRGGHRASHKPLLLLYALARQVRDHNAKFKFSDIEEDVRELLNEFYKPLSSRNHHVEFPFWRLRKEKANIWKVRASGKIKETKSYDAHVKDLRKHNATGSFSKEIVQEIRDNPDIALQAARKLLDQHFSEPLHQLILERVGFDYETAPAEKYSTKKTKRDRKFRENVLEAYEYSCAICGFDLHINTTPVGLEAAHIRWHQRGGPDTENNGLALCATHHKLLDLGAFTLSEDYRIVLSKSIHSLNSRNNFVEKYQRRKIKLPREAEHFPSLEHIQWHWKEVFREPELVLT